MKHLKMLGLFAMAAAALMAFAGSASAATFTSPTGTAYSGTLKASLQGSALLKAGFAEITCTEGEVHGDVTTNNDTHATGPITLVSFAKCGSATVDTLSSTGTITIEKGTHTVSGTGVQVTTAVAGTSCVYGLGTGTDLGTATNTIVNSKDVVTLDVNAKLPKEAGGFLCASPAAWTANYIVTTPAESYAD